MILDRLCRPWSGWCAVCVSLGEGMKFKLRSVKLGVQVKALVKLWVRSWSYGLYDGAVEAACVHPLAPSLLPQHLRAHQQFVGVLIPVFCNHSLQFLTIARHVENIIVYRCCQSKYK